MASKTARLDFPAVSAPALPRLSVLVAAWNEANNIDAFIQSFLSLAYPNRELVLCAGGSDGTFQKAVSYASDRVFVLKQQPGEGKQKALRRALEHAFGDIIILTDADCLMSEDALLRLIEPIRRGEASTTSGHCKPKISQLSNPFVFYQYAMERRWEPVLNRTQTLKAAMLGRNSAVLRTVLDEVGGFAEDVATGTDSFLAKKIDRHGYVIRFVPDSVVETDFPTSLTSFIRQRSRWSRNGIKHSWQFGLYGKALRSLVPSARGLALLALPLLGLRFGRAILYLWASLLTYSYAVRVVHVRNLRADVPAVSTSVYWRIPSFLFAEWGAQAIAPFQMLSARARNKW